MELFKLFGRILIDNEEANEALDNTDKKGEKTTGTFGKLGGAAGALGGLLVGAVATGAAAAAAGIGGLFVASDNMAKALNGLQTQTGASSDELEGMEKSLKNIYKNNYGESFQDIADTMAYAKQATGAFGEDLEWLTQDALMLRDTFGLEVQESLRGADAIMQQFGKDGTEAMAFIAEATQKGLNKNDDLVDTIEEYSVYFKNAGMDAQDMFGIFESASKAGVRNLDYVGDAMKEFGIIMKEDGDKATTALNGLGLNAGELRAQFAKGGEGAKTAFQTIMGQLAKVEDPLKRNQLGVELFGTKFEDLEADAVLAMSNIEGTITGSVDTLNEINEIKYDSFGEALQGIGRNLMMGVFEPFQNRVMPIVNDFANWMVEKMPVVEEIASKTFNGFLDVIIAVYDFFKAYILPVLTELYGWIESNMPIIQKTGTTFFSAIKEYALTLWKFFKENMLPILLDLFNWIQGHMPTIRATATAVFNKIKEVISGVWAFIVNNLLPILSGLYGWIQANMPQIKSIIENAFKVAAKVIKLVWDIIENILLPALKLLWDWVSPYIPKIGKIIGDAFSAIFKAVDKVVGVFEEVVDAIQKAIDWLTFWDNKKVKKKTIEVEERRVSTGDYNIKRNYTGTRNFRGGLTWAGEHGPELIELPGGAKINSANDSRSMLGNTINFDGFMNGATIVIREEADIENLARKIGDYVKMSAREGGVIIG